MFIEIKGREVLLGISLAMAEPMAESTENKRPKMTDEERQQLAEKLDHELDEYIGSLEKRAYTEGWPEDRWQEEMEKHPFFMTKVPEDGEVSPLVEGLQQLKYSETDNTPMELAQNYKEDGNYNFKYKKYRLAVLSYTEGLNQPFDDAQLRSELFNNRAAAQYFLKNYRSSLIDCKRALSLKSDYVKARSRAAHCCLQLQRYNECITFCDEILNSSPTDIPTLEMRAKAVAGQKIAERNLRKEHALLQRKGLRDQEILNAIKQRGIQLKGKELLMSALEPCAPVEGEAQVYLDGNGCLVWPVMFLYPEYKTSDLIQHFHEDTDFKTQLQSVFETRPEWDAEGKYIPECLNIYFENHQSGNLVLIKKEEVLGQALKRKGFVVTGGTPCFLIVVDGSPVEKQLLSNQ